MRVLFDTTALYLAGRYIHPRFSDSSKNLIPFGSAARFPLLESLVFDLNLTVLPLSAAHSMGPFGPPAHHLDPFDRALIAIALAEGVPIVARDRAFRRYRSTEAAVRIIVFLLVCLCTVCRIADGGEWSPSRMIAIDYPLLGVQPVTKGAAPLERVLRSDGTVESARIASIPRLFGAHALQSFSSWRFRYQGNAEDGVPRVVVLLINPFCGMK